MQKLLQCAPAAVLAALLAASAGAQERPPAAGQDEYARAQSAEGAMPRARLEARFLRCSAEASQRVLDLTDAIACAMAWDLLLQREFGGRVDALLAWWRARKDAVPPAD